MEKLVLSSSYSLQASRLCLLLACATLLFLPSHVVAAVASDCLSRLDVDRSGNSGAPYLDLSESVDRTSLRAESYHAAAVVPAENERSQNLQLPLRMGGSKHSSIYLMKAGRKLLSEGVTFARSPPASDKPTPLPNTGIHVIDLSPPPLPPF